MTSYTLHPEVVLGIERGELVVRLGDRPLFSTSEADVALAVFAALRVPATKLELARALPEVEVGELLDALEAEGAIIPAEAAAAIADHPAVIQTMMSEVVDLAHRIAGEAAGQGSRATAVQRQLQDILIKLAQAEVTLRASRREHLSSQLDRLGIAAASKLRLHLGASQRVIPGWINIDVAPAELAMDLRWGLPFEDGAAELVFLSHFLEHLSAAEARHLLDDVHRVLGDGGVVRVIVPNFRRYAEAYVRGDARFFAKQAEHWSWAAQMKTDLERILRYAAGADADPRTFMAVHRYGYDFETLALLLRDVGFSTVVESAYMASARPALQLDDQTGYAAVELDGRSFSLFVEATK